MEEIWSSNLILGHVLKYDQNSKDWEKTLKVSKIAQNRKVESSFKELFCVHIRDQQGFWWKILQRFPRPCLLTIKNKRSAC